MAAGARSGPREAALYLNFDVRTNPAVRAPLLAALRHRPFVRLGRPLPYPAYLAEMAGHHFCLSPPGNGLDCHRTWECLYLGVVPVVRRGDGDALLSGLPVIACDDLAGLDAETLARGWRALAGRVFDDRPLRLSTWRARIAAAAGA